VNQVQLFCGLCGAIHVQTRSAATASPFVETYRCQRFNVSYEAVFGRVRSKSSQMDRRAGRRLVKLRAYHGAAERLWEFYLPLSHDIEAKSSDEFALVFWGDEVQGWHNFTVHRAGFFGNANARIQLYRIILVFNFIKTFFIYIMYKIIAKLQSKPSSKRISRESND
jgi:hypothetical protein